MFGVGELKYKPEFGLRLSIACNGRNPLEYLSTEAHCANRGADDNDCSSYPKRRDKCHQIRWWCASLSRSRGHADVHNCDWYIRGKLLADDGLGLGFKCWARARVEMSIIVTPACLCREHLRLFLLHGLLGEYNHGYVKLVGWSWVGNAYHNPISVWVSSNYEP